MLSNYLSLKYKDLNNFILKEKNNYAKAKPFPHLILNNFFDSNILKEILNHFPKKLEDSKESLDWNNMNEKKTTATPLQIKFNDKIYDFFNLLNSCYFLNFLQQITGIKEKLIPDPYFWGGGLSSVKRGGFLKIHADFNVHPKMKLNRRINMLIYLNKDWKEDYGGHLELWNRDMSECQKKILPEFNTVVIFNTNDFSYHGHPDPLLCPDNMARKSLALYYYTNGRPVSEINIENYDHSSIWKDRKSLKEVKVERVEYKKVFGKFYVKKKFKP